MHGTPSVIMLISILTKRKKNACVSERERGREKQRLSFGAGCGEWYSNWGNSWWEMNTGEGMGVKTLQN